MSGYEARSLSFFAVWLSENLNYSYTDIRLDILDPERLASCSRQPPQRLQQILTSRHNVINRISDEVNRGDNSCPCPWLHRRSCWDMVCCTIGLFDFTCLLE